MTLDERLRTLLSRARPGDVEPTVSAMIEAFEDRYPKTLRLTPAVRDMLEAWSGRVRMAVVSNFFLPGGPARLLRDFRLGEYFEFVIDSAEFGVKKPGHAIYRAALERAATAPARVLFAGDHLRNDVETPSRLGMQALHLDRSSERASASTPPEFRSVRHWDRFRP